MNKISKKDIFLFMKSMEQMEMDYDFVSFFFSNKRKKKNTRNHVRWNEMRMIANFKLVAYSNSPFKSRYPCSDHHNSLQLYLNTKLSANPIFF